MGGQYRKTNTRRTRSSGQTYAEYVVLLSFVVLGLLLFYQFIWTDEGLIRELKSFFEAYSFSLSLP